MTRFVKFPRTPCLLSLGAANRRGDKVLDPEEVDKFLSHELAVEEKVDGSNVGISLDSNGYLQVQTRGDFVRRHDDRMPKLWRWLDLRNDQLISALAPGLILFGEWCYAVHSIEYNRLPDWFLAFDVYDSNEDAFWATSKRDALAMELEIEHVPELARGLFSVSDLTGLIKRSAFGDQLAEGIYLRYEENGWLVLRAKIIAPGFTQSIAGHWLRQPKRKNALSPLNPRIQRGLTIS